MARNPSANPLVQTLIEPPRRELGDGFVVRRALPSAERRSVGPFVFFDEIGPTGIGAGKGLDVRPHPHIGLATVTYLFEGEILHRDSLGTVQAIRPGEVNWMTAGRGIVHSERTPPELRTGGSRLSGIQTWIALPDEQEECEPSFSHHGSLPELQEAGVTVRLILGDLLGLASPVATLSPTFYADVTLAGARRFAVPAKHEERGLYLVDGSVVVAGRTFPPKRMLVLEPGEEVLVESTEGARLLIFGGARLGERFVWWNFVSSRRERIRQAADDWRSGRFPAVPGETEFIPLPDRGPEPEPVDYP